MSGAERNRRLAVVLDDGKDKRVDGGIDAVASLFLYKVALLS